MGLSAGTGTGGSPTGAANATQAAKRKAVVPARMIPFKQLLDVFKVFHSFLK